MSVEAWTIIGTGLALAALIITTSQRLSARLDTVDKHVGDLRERMARLEGLFEGFTRRDDVRRSPPSPP